MEKLIWVVDTETTGEKPPSAAICEIAAVPVSQDGKVVASKAISSLINPGHPIPDDCRGVHHISNADVSKSMSIEQVMSRGPFKKLCNGVMLAAHNMEFDWQFLQPHIKASGLLCTYRLALHLYPDAPNHKNQTLRYYTGAEPPKTWLRGLAPHRALYDAFCTAFILSDMLKKKSIDELLSLMKTPAILKICPYKAHKGQPWSSVPPDYLRWILRGNDHSPEVVATAKHWLSLRNQNQQETAKWQT